ncbi:hypothetical protein [Endothiovibrio diazotrophicus]
MESEEQQSAVERSVTLADLWLVMVRRRRLVGVVFLATLAAAMVYLISTPRDYTGRSAIKVGTVDGKPIESIGEVRSLLAVICPSCEVSVPSEDSPFVSVNLRSRSPEWIERRLGAAVQGVLEAHRKRAAALLESTLRQREAEAQREIEELDRKIHEERQEKELTDAEVAQFDRWGEVMKMRRGPPVAWMNSQPYSMGWRPFLGAGGTVAESPAEHLAKARQRSIEQEERIASMTAQREALSREQHSEAPWADEVVVEQSSLIVAPDADIAVRPRNPKQPIVLSLLLGLLLAPLAAFVAEFSANVRNGAEH